MTNIEQDANTEARHGNREALEAMTRRAEKFEMALIKAEMFLSTGFPDDAGDVITAALSDTPEVT